MCVAGTISAGRWSLRKISRNASCALLYYAPFTEVLNALGGENVVVPLPRELSLHVALGGKALQSLDNLEVGDVKLFVLRRIVILLGDQNTL